MPMKDKNKNPWIVHVKQVASRRGISYAEALKIANKNYKNKMRGGAVNEIQQLNNQLNHEYQRTRDFLSDTTRRIRDMRTDIDVFDVELIFIGRASYSHDMGIHSSSASTKEQEIENLKDLRNQYQRIIDDILHSQGFQTPNPQQG